MSRPRVLQIFHGFIEGGSERQMIQLTKLLHACGDYDVHVATLGIGGVLRSEMEGLHLPIIDFHLRAFMTQIWFGKRGDLFLT
jgi:hypothetical protein